MRTFHPYELGATLFVPATHKNLVAIARREKFPLLRSLVIDTEDGIMEEDIDNALITIQNLLAHFSASNLLCFIRPRNPKLLRLLLTYPGIEHIDGFIFPKFGLGTMEEYLDVIAKTSFHFMPSIEGAELFDSEKLRLLRDALLPYRTRIPLVRFGAEDMLRQLGLRRDCSCSLFDMSAPNYVLGSLLSVFKPHGFAISGGVYRCYKDPQGFKNDLMRDLHEGLISKTIIHPDQIKLVDECYRVTKEELDAAQQLLASGKAVFSLSAAMAETSTQRPWAHDILLRESLFGITPS